MDLGVRVWNLICARWWIAEKKHFYVKSSLVRKFNLFPLRNFNWFFFSASTRGIKEAINFRAVSHPPIRKSRYFKRSWNEMNNCIVQRKHAKTSCNVTNSEVRRRANKFIRFVLTPTYPQSESSFAIRSLHDVKAVDVGVENKFVTIYRKRASDDGKRSGEICCNRREKLGKSSRSNAHMRPFFCVSNDWVPSIVVSSVRACFLPRKLRTNFM